MLTLVLPTITPYTVQQVQSFPASAKHRTSLGLKHIAKKSGMGATAWIIMGQEVDRSQAATSDILRWKV